MKIGQVIRDEFDGKKDLSGIGGVESGRDAAEFLLLGANTVQVSHTHEMHVAWLCPHLASTLSTYVLDMTIAMFSSNLLLCWIVLTQQHHCSQNAVVDSQHHRPDNIKNS